MQTFWNPAHTNHLQRGIAVQISTDLSRVRWAVQSSIPRIYEGSDQECAPRPRCVPASWKPTQAGDSFKENTHRHTVSGSTSLLWSPG